MNHTLINDLTTILEYLAEEIYEYERYQEQDPPIDPKTHIGAELLRIRDWVHEERRIQELYQRVQERGQA
jgi:hypothetical protein